MGIENREECKTCPDFLSQEGTTGACGMRYILAGPLRAMGIPIKKWPESGESWCAEYVKTVIQPDETK